VFMEGDLFKRSFSTEGASSIFLSLNTIRAMPASTRPTGPAAGASACACTRTRSSAT
jgi:hypothetical protein